MIINQGESYHSGGDEEGERDRFRSCNGACDASDDGGGQVHYSTWALT